MKFYFNCPWTVNISLLISACLALASYQYDNRPTAEELDWHAIGMDRRVSDLKGPTINPPMVGGRG